MRVNWAEAYARRRPWEAVALITGISGTPLRLMVASSISIDVMCKGCIEICDGQLAGAPTHKAKRRRHGEVRLEQ
jgi:hypothetical protein